MSTLQEAIRQLVRLSDKGLGSSLKGAEFATALELLRNCWDKLQSEGGPGEATLTVEGLYQAEQIYAACAEDLEIEVPCMDQRSPNPTYRLVYLWKVDLSKKTKARFPRPLRRLANPRACAIAREMFPAFETHHRRHFHRGKD